MQVVFPDLETPYSQVIVRPPDRPQVPADDYFGALCAANPEMRIERLSSGEIVIMAPTGFETGYKNNEISRQLADWARRDGRGLVADSSTVYRLRNDARRSPDASWVAKNRLAPLSREQKRGFLPLCPDFVIELRSPTDSVHDLRTKLREWIEQGAQLG
jgi:Uma2 family endonuclease